MKTISIITPSYNQAQFLPRCLDSVSGQTVKPFEHIVLDPGSGDGSREIAAGYPGVKLVAEPDDGQSEAIGKGFAMATGDILAWLNSDDMYAGVDTFAAVIERFEAADKPDVVYGRVVFVDERDEKLKDGYVNPDAGKLLESFHYQVGIVQPGVFLRREVFEKVGGPALDMHFTLDYEYWVRIAAAGFKWGYLDKLVAKHRWWSGMKTASRRVESLYEHFDTCKKHFGYVHYKWVDRQVDCILEGADGIVTQAAASKVSDIEKDALRKKLFLEANGDDATRRLLRESKDPSIRETAERMAGLGIESRNPNYFDPEETEVKATGFAREGDESRPVAWRRSRGRTSDGVDVYGYEVTDNFRAFYRKEWLDAQFRRARERLEALGSARRSDTCIVVGNGPSLRKVDFGLFDGVDVVISNFATLDAELLGKATFHTVTNFLVARQGCHQFNRLDGVTKIYPYWLSQYLLPDEQTLYLDALLTPEASADVSDWISWRSTVSFFNLQLAYTLGYKKVILLGFDHSYKQDASAKEGDLIEQKEDDENHFLKSYFKGKVWQAADVGQMEAVYRLARDLFEADGREIVNCTAGGGLELFRRADLRDELPHRPAAAPGAIGTVRGRPAEYPRVLVIDPTPISGVSATGQLKARLFDEWPKENLLQVYSPRDDELCVWALAGATGCEGRPLSEGEVRRILFEFAPEVVYFRPVDYPASLFEFGARFLDETGLPYGLHIMDDWPERLRFSRPGAFSAIDGELRRLIAGAGACLSIGESMSEAFQARYGRAFIPVANGVDIDEGQPVPKAREHGEPMVVRYSGALAEDMTLATVRLIAQAIEKLSREIPVRFEIYTMDVWRERALEEFSSYNAVTVNRVVERLDGYRKLLETAGLLVIGYNFDAASLAYTRYSIANKLPECLSSGTPLMVVGPDEAATVALAKTFPGVKTVTEENSAAIKAAIRAIYTDPAKATSDALAARAEATERLSLGRYQQILGDTLHKLSRSSTGWTTTPFSRDNCARVDEVDLIASVLIPKVQDGLMLDVGAHFGSTLLPFARAGWRVHAFEPDPSNRAKLEKAAVPFKDVIVDSRAVSDSDDEAVSFYSSEESSGISSLRAFRPTHRETARVTTVTLSRFCEENQIEKVDFLKIDTEGLDLMVLQGVPWDRIKPRVVLAEFEDAKSTPLGYDVRRIAGFLQEKGYHLLVSEWHPIVRYGIPHDWRRLATFPCEPASARAWGNLMAFQDREDAEAVKEILRGKVSFKSVPEPISDTPAATRNGANGKMEPGAHSGGTGAGGNGKKPSGPAAARKAVFALFLPLMGVLLGASAVLAIWLLAGAPAGLRMERTVLLLLALSGIGMLIGFGLDGRRFRRRFRAIREENQRTAQNLRGRITQEGSAARRALREQKSTLAARIESECASLRNRVAALEEKHLELEENQRRNSGRWEAKFDKLAQSRSELALLRRRVVLLEQIADIPFSQTPIEDGTIGKEEAARIDYFKKRGQRANYLNQAAFQQFNRFLSVSDRDEILRKWLPVLRLELDQNGLSYLAHKICTVEDLCDGRYATNVQDALLRVLAARSLLVETGEVRLLEIGALFGINIAALYAGNRGFGRRFTVSAIDPMTGYYSEGGVDLITRTPVDEKVFRHNMRMVDVAEEDVELIPFLSTQPEAREAAAKKRYNYLIIDGDHTYAGVKFDFDGYHDLVDPGGYILFDDFGGSEWPDVSSFVEKEVRPREDMEFVGSAWRTAIFRKKADAKAPNANRDDS